MVRKLACLIATVLVTVAGAPVVAGGPVAAGGGPAAPDYGLAAPDYGLAAPGYESAAPDYGLDAPGAVASHAVAAASGSASDPGVGSANGVVQAGNCTYPVTRTDATGTAVTVSSEPQTVVTLSPSAAQTMWDVGGRGKVVGVSQFATYLEGASNRTNVSGAGQTPVNVEAVVSLQPDLVLAPNVIPNESVESLRRAGLTVYRFRAAGSIEDVVEKTRLTGRLTGECEGAAETVASMRERLATVRAAVADEPRPRVLYTFFGFTAGNGTFVHEVITTAGGRNVAAEAGLSGFEELGEEVVVQGDPEWLLLNSDGPQVPRSPAYNSTTAVRQNQTVVVNGDYVSQPGPRIVQPVVTLAKALHPEAYATANATATPTDAGTATPTRMPATSTGTATPTATVEDTADPTGPTDETGAGAIPAPGPAAALAAVLGGAALAAHRRR